jgi:CrcB protein
MIVLYVCCGGVIGALGRYWLTVFITKRFPTLGIHVSTLIINGIGSFVLGAIVSASEGMTGSSVALIQGATIGIIGSFTTYSTFSLDCAKLLLNKNWFQLILYSTSTICLCVCLFIVGHYLF